MASSYDVNSVCNQIHDLVQTSGLHFVINQTPWSSFITIRRKFINPKHVPVIQPPTEATFCTDNLTRMTEINKQLVVKNVGLEEALASVEEEHRAAALKNEDTRENLHNTIDHLERKIIDLESELRKKEIETSDAKNVIETKNEIIKNINKGFNEKFRDMKDKLEALEEEKKKQIKKEKKAAKKEKKAAKKLKQKMVKAEKILEKKEVSEVDQNENDIEKKDETQISIYQCNYCDFAKTRNELEDHVLEVHNDQVGELVRKF